VKLSLPHEQIAEFCRKWHVSEFALFGSVLRDDFRPDSDVDVLVTFRPDSRVSLFDFPGMQDELEAIFGHPVDLLTRRGVEESRNPYRKKSILDSAKVVYAAA
jgi:predicted nucleotidyltransferase